MHHRTEINVNDLASILKAHFKCKDIYIEKVSVASTMNQHIPRSHDIGVGGQLNIVFESSRRLK